MATKVVLLATQLALVTAAAPCHPMDGHEYKIYVHGYVGSHDDRQQWLTSIGDYWIYARGVDKENAVPFLFKGVPGFCNQYKLQDNFYYSGGSQKDVATTYWIGFVDGGSHSLRAYYSESSADPILFIDNGNGEYVLKSAWPGNEYGSTVRADSDHGYISYSAGQYYEVVGGHCPPHTILPGYTYSNAMVVSLVEMGARLSEESEGSYSRAFVVEPVIGFFAGCAVVFGLLRQRYRATSAPKEPLLTA